MEEQISGTAARLLSRNPRRVLEVGCGTGLLLYRLTPHCEQYFGTDFSRPLIQSLHLLSRCTEIADFGSEGHFTAFKSVLPHFRCSFKRKAPN
jgi:SAM-dependent methyltransferase